MPVRGSCHAPRTFKGKYSEIERFIDHYERLLQQHHVSSEADKCKGVKEYCSDSVIDFIESSPHFTTPHWKNLKDDLLKYYDADRTRARFRPADLFDFVQKSSSKPCENLAQWKKYYCKYNVIAGALLKKSVISARDVSGYFWYGIPAALRRTLELKLQAKLPNHNTANPYNVSDVTSVAEAYFKRDKFSQMFFHANQLDLEYNSETESSEESSSDSDSSNSEYDSDSIKKLRSKLRKLRNKEGKKRSKHKQKYRNHTSKEPKSEPERTYQPSGNSTEIESMIQQLNTMSLEDPKYGHLYYKVMKMDQTGLAAKCIYREPPKQIQQPITQVYTAPSATTVPVQPPVIQPPMMQPRLMQQQPYEPFQGCFGCLDLGHHLSECPKMSDLAQRGIVMFDAGSRKYFMTNGQPIFRQRGESLFNAAQWIFESTKQAHFLTFSTNVQDYPNQYESESEPKSKLQPVVEITKLPPQISTARQPAKQPLSIIQEPKPIDARQIRFPEDIVMTDATVKPFNPKSSGLSINHPQLGQQNKENIASDKAQGQPRQSDLSSQVDTGNVVQQILDMQVSLPLQNILGTSKELSTSLQEVIRLKNKSTGISALVNNTGIYETFNGLSRPKNEVLIQLDVMYNGNSITAIIDTGSQLNVVSDQVANNVLKLPIDLTKSVYMNDANGGASRLKGLIENVKLTCGGVITYTDLYAGETVPFDLLLGRPWQRGNYVSID
ncbi:hypothetical protein FA15DRAFT_606153 [Coprinopsis marcescibilis]|uniref:DUF4100 domain-containing protein n=1 Tax=Coprinopsis marcescibilis TaxID=230819 RepID=A0A5C3KAK9_COPMA|nr:hypothetical protein FA15DRAFT_606153 [Coprinopsis marcescibilis]